LRSAALFEPAALLGHVLRTACIAHGVNLALARLLALRREEADEHRRGRRFVRCLAAIGPWR